MPGQDPAQDGSQDQGDEDEGEQPAPGAKASKGAELEALRAWRRNTPARRRDPGGLFKCEVLTRADVPHWAADARIVFKADDAGPKALSGTGPAGSGTRSW